MNDKMITGATFPRPLFDALRAMGMPDHITKFKMECAGPEEIVEFTCTFYAADPALGLLDNLETKKYVFVEQE